MEPQTAHVLAVSISHDHTFSKKAQQSIRLLAGLGVEGDAHLGKQVKHRSRVRRDPDQPNLRQVHLMHREIHEELNAKGYSISPGDLGENITTQGIELLALPRGTRLRVGSRAVIEVTGLRNPCYQLDDFQEGLMQAMLDKDIDGTLIRKAGIMGIVVADGLVQPGDEIATILPESPHFPLDAV